METEYRETLLVILGAGASFDCVPPGLDPATMVSSPGLPSLPLEFVRPPITQDLASARPEVVPVVVEFEVAVPLSMPACW
jgi:hypothetical protein